MSGEIKIGDYIVEHKLAEDGMCELWKAHHVALDKSVVIQCLHSDFNNNRELLERFGFINQSRLRLQLSHPNIVDFNECIQQDGLNYLVMPYVDGENLATRLAQQSVPFNIEDALRISRAVLSALGYIHSHGLAHGDLNLSNILLENNGHVWLRDVGLWRMDSHTPLRTRAIYIGTFPSPEQIMNPRQMDGRSDIYAFGCLLYEMLCGKPPFGGESEEPHFCLLDRHVRTPPVSPRQHNPLIPVAVEQVIMKCLEKKPDDRFSNCDEVMNALDVAIPVGDNNRRKAGGLWERWIPVLQKIRKLSGR